LEKRGIRAPRLILFGSAATGTMHEGSDIDLVVISDSFRGKDYWDRIDILGDAVYEVFEPIQAIALTPDEWDRGDSLVVHFARNGQSV
jgi:predicted nucleotidyltransferase